MWNHFFIRWPLCGFFCLILPTLLLADGKIEPSNAQELKQKKVAIQKEVDAQFVIWKQNLSPEQQAWETVLEENLGSFYLPIYKTAKVKNRKTAWDYVKDDPDLPRILLIGDSVSRGYTQAVRNALQGKANVHRAPANCGPTRTGLQKLDIWLGEGNWDLISFNFGIHDRKTDTAIYEQNLKMIITRLEKRTGKLLWVETTPIPDGTKYGPNAAIIERNDIAGKIMQENRIPVCPLYGWIDPDLQQYQNKDDVHFSGAGYVRLAEKVSKEILDQLSLE